MNKQFGTLLNEGISSIAHRWHKTKAAVRREMTQKLHEAGFHLTDSTVDGWCRGFVPKEPELVAWIVRYCTQRGRVDRHWVESLLYQAHYPERTVLLKELFPSQGEAQNGQLSSKGQPIQYVEDPALTLRARSTCKVIGRKELLADLKERLMAVENQRVLALTGLPGVGKTTLALELAQSHEIRETFRDGILYVNLGSQPDIEHHLERWARLLGLIGEGTQLADRQRYIEAIHASIGKRQMLLIIEDAWKIEDALPFQIGGSYCTHLLTTRFSDIALSFAGQSVVRVTELNEDESKQLLAHFVPQIVRNESEHIHSLIQAVSGLPLALTLIGRYLQVQSFHRQPRRLQHALLALQRATERLSLQIPQGPLEVQQNSLSLMATIGTSYEALSASAQRALRQLSIFQAKPSTFSEEAALQVAVTTPTVLDELTDAGLLESAEGGRYTIHQTIADYGLLKHRGIQAETRLVTFFVAYAEAHTKDYPLLDQEVQNIMHALSLASREKMLKLFVRGVQAFFPFMLLRGWHQTALRYCLQELEATRTLEDQAGICQALIHLGTLNFECGNFAQVEAYAEEGLALAYHLHDAVLISTLLRLRGWVAFRKGENAQAATYGKEGLALARQLGDNELICLHLLLLGTIAGRQGAYDQAEEKLQEALFLAREINQLRAINHILTALGTLASVQGNYRQAESYYQEGLIVAREGNHIERVSAFLQGLAYLAGLRCEYALAERYLQEALPLVEAMGLREHQVILLGNLANVAVQRGQSSQAEESFLKALGLARNIGNPTLITDLLVSLGTFYSKVKQLENAVIYLKEGITLATEIGHHYPQREGLFFLCLVYMKQSKWQCVQGYLEELEELVKQAHSQHFKGKLCNAWGEYYLQQGYIDDAHSFFQQALELARKLDEKETIAHALFGLARVAQAQSNSAQAQLFGEESKRIFAEVDMYSADDVEQWQEECS